MPQLYATPVDKETPSYDYEADPRWRNKPFTPAQIQVHDIRLEKWRPDRGPMLECNERFASAIVPETAASVPSASYVRAADAASNPIEKQRFATLEEEYGWMRQLRLLSHQQHAYDSEDSAKCRWIHCASKFPEYLRGALWALSKDLSDISACLQTLDNTIQRQTRFSKHGKCFAPFSQPLAAHQGNDMMYPMLLSVPFLDWSILGAKPPLRFQVDRREGFHSARSSSHLLRSVLQHFYRLEDTGDREASQVFAKHKPWSTNRELDLKVRQWYGHYPSALDVDEVWILLIDAEHIVTFSSNQTWKSRWPPLQLATRISDISFRGIRNAFFASQQKPEYDSMTHAVACLSGAVGMMHRNFWPDLVLPCTDRYAGYLGHLQYRLHRSPSTKLVMDLIACQEELNIVINITQQQVDMIIDLQSLLQEKSKSDDTNPSPISTHQANYGNFDEPPNLHQRVAYNSRATYRQISTSTVSDPLAQVLDNLQRELIDLQDLRDNTDRLVTRTIQLVNIRLEDHGKAILVFTVVTIVFLPLNFVSSFFGMNFSDIREMRQTQWLFWAVALCITAGVVAASLFLAFSGGAILEKMLLWKDQRRERQLTDRTARKQTHTGPGGREFKIIGAERVDGFNLHEP
jgi:Mg2+ and Co2+ transporter CorA